MGDPAILTACGGGAAPRTAGAAGSRQGRGLAAQSGMPDTNRRRPDARSPRREARQLTGAHAVAVSRRRPARRPRPTKLITRWANGPVVEHWQVYLAGQLPRE